MLRQILICALPFLAFALAAVALRWLPRRPVPLKRPFEPKGSRPPSDRLRAIAQQRRRARLARPTAAELRFNEILSGLGFVEGRDYERESIFYYPGSFCLFDFYFSHYSLIVELDGGVHNEASQRTHDLGRDAYLIARGLRTCRIPNRTVLGHPRACRDIILAELGFPVRQNLGTRFPVPPIPARHDAQGRSTLPAGHRLAAWR